MAGTYEIWLTTDRGMRLADNKGKTLLTQIISLSCVKDTGKIGYISITLPVTFDTNLIKPDNMIQLWRAPTGGRLTLYGVYFIRKWVYTTKKSRQFITIEGPDANDLLRRRIVAGYNGTTIVQKTDFGDDMMKEIVTEAIADGVSPAPSAGTRVWTDLTVQGDTSSGPTLSIDAAWEQLLISGGGGVIGNIAQASREAGTEVFFNVDVNVVTSTSISFIFTTKTGQPGQDLTSLGVLFDQQRGNLENPQLTYDYTEEVNYVYAGGAGSETLQKVQQVSDSARYNASYWGRCEGFVDAGDQQAANAVQEVGRTALEEGRPNRRFVTGITDTKGTRFEVDWNFGDKIRTRYRGIEFDAIIRAVVLELKNGKEIVKARLEFEE